MFEFQNPNETAEAIAAGKNTDCPEEAKTKLDFDGISADPIDQRDIEVLLDEAMEEALHGLVLGYCGGRDILTEVTDSATSVMWEKFKNGEITPRQLLTAAEVLRRMFRNTEVKNDIIAG